MNSVFSESFSGMLEALGQIFFIAVIAGILVRKRIFPDSYLKGLSYMTVNILLPALIFSNTLQTFRPEEQAGWWLLPLTGFVMAAGGLLSASLFFLRSFKTHKDVLPVAGLQNSGYLILPIGQIVFPEDFDEFALYVFLFIIGFNAVLWSIGKYLLSSGETKEKFTLKALLTAPLVANIVSVLIVLIGFERFVPDFVIKPVGLIGSATVPVATFILGATLGTISVRKFPPWHVLARVVFVKLFLIAGITVLILHYSGLRDDNPLMCRLILLEASAAPAASLIVMVRNFGGDRQKIGSLMLFSYVLSLITMPFWIALWETL